MQFSERDKSLKSKLYHNENENNVAAKMIIPPIVGTIRLCIFLPPGSSNNRFRIATLISGGVAYNTTKKEVMNTSIKVAIYSVSKYLLNNDVAKLIKSHLDWSELICVVL